MNRVRIKSVSPMLACTPSQGHWETEDTKVDALFTWYAKYSSIACEDHQYYRFHTCQDTGQWQVEADEVSRKSENSYSGVCSPASRIQVHQSTPPPEAAYAGLPAYLAGLTRVLNSSVPWVHGESWLSTVCNPTISHLVHYIHVPCDGTDWDEPKFYGSYRTLRSRSDSAYIVGGEWENGRKTWAADLVPLMIPRCNSPRTCCRCKPPECRHQEGGRRHIRSYCPLLLVGPGPNPLAHRIEICLQSGVWESTLPRQARRMRSVSCRISFSDFCFSTPLPSTSTSATTNPIRRYPLPMWPRQSSTCQPCSVSRSTGRSHAYILPSTMQDWRYASCRCSSDKECGETRRGATCNVVCTPYGAVLTCL